MNGALRLARRVYDRTLYHRVLGRYGWEPPIFDQPDACWADARTLDDLGELTARWLEGAVARQPGYGGPVDTDEVLAPGMTAILAACNRAGYVTTNSQAGSARYDMTADVHGFTYPGATWPQLLPDRFDVTVWTEPPPVLDDAEAEAAAIAWQANHSGYPGMDAEDIDVWFSDCHPDALAAAHGAWQVTVWDPTPDSNDLWPALAAALGA